MSAKYTPAFEASRARGIVSSGELCLLVSVLALALLSNACSPPKAPPTPAQIAGIYKPTGKTSKLLLSMGYASNELPTISLNADSSYAMTNIPDLWPDGPGQDRLYGKRIPNPGMFSSKGRWQLSDESLFFWFMNVDFDTRVYVASATPGVQRIKRGGGVSHFIEFYDQTPPKLHLILGDPDSGIGFDFLKQSKAN